MVHGIACPFGNPDILHHFLNLPGGSLGEGTNREGDRKIDQHPQKAYAFRRDTEPVVLAFAQELEIDDVTESEDNSADHSRYRSFPVHLFGEDSKNESGKKRGCGQSEGKGHGFGDKAGRWIDSKVCGDYQGSEGGDSGIANFLSIGDVRFDDFLHQVMRDRSGENEEQTCGSG